MISICPQCRKQVAVPRDAEPSTRVRCPLCEAEYPLSESLDLAPPELIVLVPFVEGSAAEPVIHIDLGDVDRRETFAVASTSASLRPRYQKSGLRVFFEVIAGGIAGCLVAYYALAFYYGPQFRRVGLPELPLPFISRIIAPRDTKHSEQPVVPDDLKFDFNRQRDPFGESDSGD